jgi:hypothetical protein
VRWRLVTKIGALVVENSNEETVREMQDDGVLTWRRSGEEVALDPEEAPGSGEPRRTASKRTQARASSRDSARRSQHGRCCHRRLNDGRRWSRRNGRRLIVSRGGGPATATALTGRRELLNFPSSLAPSDPSPGADGSVVLSVSRTW